MALRGFEAIGSIPTGIIKDEAGITQSRNLPCCGTRVENRRGQETSAEAHGRQKTAGILNTEMRYHQWTCKATYLGVLIVALVSGWGKTAIETVYKSVVPNLLTER
jgi:hypothetical protein